MPRRREIPKREILPDPKHKSEEVAKFMNVLMTRGKKSVAERIMYGALDTIAKKSGKDAFEVFNAAITQPSGAWRRTSSATACGPSRRRCRGCRAPCGSARQAGPSRGRRE